MDNTRKLDNNISPFYLELLEYFSELRDQYRDDCFKGDLIIWNNKDITTEVEIWNFHNTNEKVHLLLQNDGKIPTRQSFQTET